MADTLKLPNTGSIAGVTKGDVNLSKVNSAKLTADQLASKLSKEKNQNIQCTDADIFTVKRGTSGFSGSTSGAGFTNAKYSPPKIPQKTPQAVPPKGTSSVTTLERGMVCGTNIGAANADLVFECNFVAGIQIETCLKNFEYMVKAKVEEGIKLVWAKALALLPSADWIRGIIDSICALANEIQRIVCIIQQVMTCIIGTIQAIVGIVEWILSLPVRFLSMLIQCISGFFSSITSALSRMVSSLATSFNVTDCGNFECKQATSIYDIGDTASGIGTNIGLVSKPSTATTTG